MARDDPPSPHAPGAGVRVAPPTPVRAAGVLVGLQALAAAVFTAALLVRAGAARGPVLGEAGFFLLVTAAVAAVAAGLLAGRLWARTPALVTQLLLLPVVYTLLSSRQLLIGVVCGVVVFAAFMLLLNERSRRWSMGADPS